jgi:hemerythrin-like domain-containing protein
MTATAVLKEEHRVIERMLVVLESVAQRLEAGERVRAELLREAVDFVRNFADKNHHGKEEANLFPRLEERGVPKEGGPLGVMLHEHDLGRGFIQAIEGAIEGYEGGDEAAALVIAENIRGYIQLLAEHIWKEENVLFQMADQVLSEADQQDLVERFERVEAEVIGPDAVERYTDLLERAEREISERR